MLARSSDPSVASHEAPPPVTLAEAVPLVSALVVDRARRVGTRAMLIKGVAATVQRLREPRTSGDVDVLVDPAGVDALVAALESDGWKRMPVKARAWFLPEHSVTLRHPVWPCEVDVHEFYPGFLAPATDVFEVLWRDRAGVEVAGRPVTTVGVPGHAAILALHSLRDAAGRETDDAYRALVEKVATTPGLASSVAELAAETGATETLAPFLHASGAPVVPGISTSVTDRVSWSLLMSAEPIPSLAWLDRLSRTDPWRWPSLLWRAFLLDEAEIRRVDQAPPGRWGLWRARLRRLGRGIRHLPRGLRALHAARRESDR